MKFENELENLKKRYDLLGIDIEDLTNRHELCRKFTAQFLNSCKEYGIKAVCIGVSHSIVPTSENFTFGTYGSVFAEERWPKDGGCPAIWRVCETMKIASGCGNTSQHQADLSNLLEGAYEYKSGKWQKIK